MSNLRAKIEALTHWAVPGSYAGEQSEAFGPARTVAMLRADEVMRVLDATALNPAYTPTKGSPTYAITTAADVNAFTKAFSFTGGTFIPGERVRVSGAVGVDGRGRVIEGVVREDGSIAWDKE